MILLLFATLLGSSSCLPLAQEGNELTLDVLHINDIHSYFEETSADSSRCREPSPQCYGGIARVFTKQKEIRERNPDTTIFLNAGDFYQGTLWYSKFKFEPMVIFGNHLNYTAMGLGNHDFDDAISGILPFAELVEFPLLASNMDAEGTDLIEGIHFHKSVVKIINGTQVGIIGYITQSTSYNFPNGSVTFSDEVRSVRAEAERLNAAGVKILIALGHSGYDIDIELAANIPLLDLVVGGHSHTFLYPEDLDDEEDYSQGPYPTYVTPEDDSSKQIPVVQAKAYTKYLGHLTLNFDSNGELKKPIKGSGVSFALPYIMNGDVEQDPGTLQMMEYWQEQLSEYKSTIGVTEVVMKERGENKESNIGNAIADSMTTVYDDTHIGIMNNGGIRSSFEKGNITGEDIYYVLPFENTVDKLVLKGSELRKALESAAKKLSASNPNKYPGWGLQVSGLKLEIDVTPDNFGRRISSFKVKNDDGIFEDLKDNNIYNVAIGSFLAPGGAQKYLRGIFDDIEVIDLVRGTETDYNVMKTWIETNSPIHPEIEGRFNINYFP